MNFHVVGIFRDFPPSNPYAEMVMSTAALPPYLVPPPDFYMAHDAGGQPPSAVAAELSSRPDIQKRFGVSTLADQTNALPRSLTALNLDGLKRIEAIGAGLIAAIGVAVLGAFPVLERRREFAVLEAVGAETSQVIEGAAQEGIITVLGSLLIGLPLGLGLGILSVRVLGLFFSLQPPLLTVPVGTLLAFILLMVATSAAALSAALVAVTRVRAANVLREP